MPKKFDEFDEELSDEDILNGAGAEDIDFLDEDFDE